MLDSEEHRDGPVCAASGPARSREELARFEAYYDFAFERVYRFARDRAETEAQAQALCELIMFRALASLDLLGTCDGGGSPNATAFAFELFRLAREVAEQVAERPELLQAPMASSGFFDDDLDAIPSRRAAHAKTTGRRS